MKTCPCCHNTTIQRTGWLNICTELTCSSCRKFYLLLQNEEIFYYQLAYYSSDHITELVSDKHEIYTKIISSDAEQCFEVSQFFPLTLDNFYAEGEKLINKLLKLKAFS
jgi:hypothetical protein